MAQQVAHPEHNPFSIDSDSDLPVGVQLTWRVRALILSGRLATGEPLPSVRRLAAWAGVNANTVRAVYDGLEDEGLVVGRQGQGTFVAEGIEAAPQLEEIAADALRRAREAGLSPRDLAIVATACASIPGEEDAGTAPPPPPDAELVELEGLQSEAIEVRHELRRQVGRLEAELASYTRDLPTDLPTAHRSAEAHLLTVAELEQTRDTLIAKLSEARKAAELRAREEDRIRAQRQEMLRPDGEPESGPLGRAMSWWRAAS